MASKKLETLLETFQGNSYPAMLEDLGNHLGVSAESCRRLALGWAPIVEFKKRTSFNGWWAIAERDADGVPVGISLRSQRDAKTMYPGSKHGLVYEVNPEHEQGGAGYSAGASNWVRTMDAGLPCAICGKPDGCLLSAENPADPKAVICRAEKVGAVRPMKFGYLHIRKDAGNLKRGMSALAGDPNEYVVVVEGFSDTAAALDLGFVGVGRPSNLACMDMLKDLVRGRKVIIVGENDKKPDGKEPGKEGMIAAFQVCKTVCSDIRMTMPPTHVKDLRAWKAKFGLTRDAFLEHVEESSEEHDEKLVLDDSRPLTIARAYLHEHFRMAGRYTVKRWASSWYRYTGAKYEEVKDEAFESPLYPWAHDKYVNQVNPTNGSTTIQPLVANTTMVQNTMRALISETLLSSTQMPCWVNGAKGIEPSDLIVFNNGLLHVPSFLNGQAEYLLDLTPDYFTTASLPFAFDGTAECPTWKLFLRKSLGDEQEKIMLLREWLGYCMTTDTKMEKMMYLRGPSGAGKGVVLHVLCKLVGEDHSVDTSFAQITRDFGTQALVGKLVCTIGDARTSGKTDVMRGLEVLLNITAGDGIQIDRKFKDPLARYKVPARITIASNDFLDVPDHAGAMLRRLNIIDFKTSFVGREDFDLKSKLTDEIPGIAVWALTGLRRLRDQKRFTIPPSSLEAAKEWRMGTSPLASFLDECCEPGGEVSKDELYDAWVQWSREKRINQLSQRKFVERVKTNYAGVTESDYTKGGHKFSVYRGLTMKPWASRRFLGRPG